VKRIVSVAATLMVVLAASPALAQPAPLPDPRGDQNSPPPPARPGVPSRPAAIPLPPAVPPGQMSPEERRKLRQDVHQHGRDLYHTRRGPPKQ
jgi:hypothetical protein